MAEFFRHGVPQFVTNPDKQEGPIFKYSDLCETCEMAGANCLIDWWAKYSGKSIEEVTALFAELECPLSTKN